MKSLILPGFIFSIALIHNTGCTHCDQPAASRDRAVPLEGYLQGDDGTGANSRARAAEAPTDIVVIIYDGLSAAGHISKAFSSAINRVPGWSSYKGYYIPGGYRISDAKARINDTVAQFGLPKSDLLCLVIGKSLGGAKTYKLLASNASFFEGFHRNSVVTVDAHDPIAPGDAGRCGRWYDYVNFRCDGPDADWNWHYYDLASNSAWNAMGANSQIGFYNAYQRDYWPRGYSFSSADVNRRVHGYNHTDIAHCPDAVSLIQKALHHLLE